MILFLTTLDHSVLPFLPSFAHVLLLMRLWAWNSKVLKYWKTWFQYFECLPPKNISNDNIWDRGLIEQDTAQLSSLWNRLVAYQDKSFRKYRKTIFQYFGLLPIEIWSYDKIPDTRPISTSRRIFWAFNTFFGLTTKTFIFLTFPIKTKS